MIVMLFLNVTLALMILAIVPVLLWITSYFQRKIIAVNRRVRAVNADLTRAYNEGISGAKTSKTLVIEEQNLQAFSQTSSDMRKNTIRACMLNALYIPIITFFSSLSVAFVLTQGGYQEFARGAGYWHTDDFYQLCAEYLRPHPAVGPHYVGLYCHTAEH